MKKKIRPEHDLKPDNAHQPSWSALLGNIARQGMGYHQDMFNYWSPHYQKDMAAHTLVWIDHFAQFWSSYAQTMLNNSLEEFSTCNRQAGYLSDAMTKMTGLNTLKTVDEKKPRYK